MNIDRVKHLKTETDELESAIAGIERIYDEAINLVKDNDLKEIIEIAVDWYETKEVRDKPGNLLYYTFFNDAFDTCNGPSSFYGGLGNFLANCILDDSYYELKWRAFDYNVQKIEGEPWKDEPYVIWVSSFDRGTQNSHDMLKAMKFAIKRDEERYESYKKFDALKEEWANKNK